MIQVSPEKAKEIVRLLDELANILLRYKHVWTVSDRKTWESARRLFDLEGEPDAPNT